MSAASPAVVAIGGGHGLSRCLAALRLAGCEPTAIVTVADDGGSSGRLRRDLGIIAPGDLRMALSALATREDLEPLFEHRFGRGELEGHALGNLLLVALAERRDGDFVAALDDAAALLGCAGRVLPATAAPVHLRARVSGAQVNGQVQIAAADGHIEQVWLDPPDAPACAPAVRAIEAADLVVLGPGSLFTSIIAALVVPRIALAVVRTAAPVALVSNLRPQPGETSGLDAEAHVQCLLDHVPGLVLDTVLVHVDPDGEDGPLGGVRAGARVRRVVEATLAEDLRDGHDPRRLERALAPLLTAVRTR